MLCDSLLYGDHISVRLPPDGTTPEIKVKVLKLVSVAFSVPFIPCSVSIQYEDSYNDRMVQRLN